MSNSLLSSAAITIIIVIVSGYVISYNADMGTVADTVFTGMLDAAYATHGALSLIAVSSIADSIDRYLNGASDVTIFKSDGNTYAAVAASGNRGVQILDITNPSNITTAGKIKDSPTMKDLRDITTFKLDGDTYAVMTASRTNNVLVLNLTDPLNIAVTDIISNSTLELNGAWGITTFKSGSDTYAAVAASEDDGVQILNVTDPSDITAISSIDDDNTRRLEGAKGITTFESRGNTYAAVASSVNDGVEILDVSNPSNITSTGRIGNDGSLELDGASGITSFKLDSDTYVAVTATAENGVQILNVNYPSNITAAGSISHTDNALIQSPTDITAFKSNDHTYLAVITSGNSGVLILDATDPSNITTASSIIDSNAVKLEGASGIATFESGGHTYVAVAASEDDAVQIIRVNGTQSTTDNVAPLIILDGPAGNNNVNNASPRVDAGPDREVDENQSITLSGSTTDINRHDTLEYTWQLTSGSPDIMLDVTNTASLRFTAPEVSDNTDYMFTLNVTDGKDSNTDTVKVTVFNVPISVLDAMYNPGSGHLIIKFNQDIAMADYNNIHVRGAGDDDVTLSSTVDPSYYDRTITATFNSTQKEMYADLIGSYLEIASDAVRDTDGDAIAQTSGFDIRLMQNKKSSSSSSSAPIVDLNRLAQARIVDIPSVISEQVSSHNTADPLEPILHNNAFDLPLTINDYHYLLDDTTNTLTPQTVIVGQSTEIEFTVYTDEDLAHFTLYLNLQDDDTRYADSDTYIRYTNDGTVTVTDPHGYIADATITVTQEDNSMPEKKTVTITIEFDEPMGLTNMVAYMWNTDRRATIINLINAIDVTADAETRQNNASTADSSTSARVNPEPDVSDDNRSDGEGSQSSVNSGIVVIGGDADNDDVQTLSLIRMWSGFASESITDAELLESMGLDNYLLVHIPNWVMTELGVLVSNNDVTVEEFRTALVYMLEMLTT